jgi:hypothetical protein
MQYRDAIAALIIARRKEMAADLAISGRAGLQG